MFDGSAKTKGNIYLNGPLLSDPRVLNLVFDVLFRFRLRPVVLVADVKQAFLDVKTDKCGQDLVRFFCYNKINKEDSKVVVHRFCRLIMEITCSPFL